MTPDQERIITAILRAGREEVLKDFAKDSCIATTRVYVECLRYFNLYARPLVVDVGIFNEEWLEHQEELMAGGNDELSRHTPHEKFGNAWSVGIGHGEVNAEDYAHHLVAYLPNDPPVVMDGALDQASRPAKDINLHSLAFEVPEMFPELTQSHGMEIEGVHLEYMALPQDRSYTKSPNWTTRSQWQPSVRRTIRRVKDDSIPQT